MEKINESITLTIEDESQDDVGHMIIHEDPESAVTTPRATTPEPTDAISDNNGATSNSAYDADTIIDSPTSTSSTLDLNDTTEIGEASGEPCLQCPETLDELRALASTRYELLYYPNAFQLPPTRDRHVIMCGAGRKCLKFKPLIHGGRFDRDSDTDTDMPHLEERNKYKEDSDEDSDDMPPLEDN